MSWSAHFQVSGLSKLYGEDLCNKLITSLEENLFNVSDASLISPAVLEEMKWPIAPRLRFLASLSEGTGAQSPRSPPAARSPRSPTAAQESRPKPVAMLVGSTVKKEHASDIVRTDLSEDETQYRCSRQPRGGKGGQYPRPRERQAVLRFMDKLFKEFQV